MGIKEKKVHRDSQIESQLKSKGEEDIVNQDPELGTTVTPTKKKKKSKKRSARDPDITATDDKFEFGTIEGDQGVDDPNEPTMGIGEDEDEKDTITPFIYEDEDESDDEESEDDMEVDQESIEHVDGDDMILKTKITYLTNHLYLN